MVIILSWHLGQLICPWLITLIQRLFVPYILHGGAEIGRWNNRRENELMGNTDVQKETDRIDRKRVKLGFSKRCEANELRGAGNNCCGKSHGGPVSSLHGAREDIELVKIG